MFDQALDKVIWFNICKTLYLFLCLFIVWTSKHVMGMADDNIIQACYIPGAVKSAPVVRAIREKYHITFIRVMRLTGLNIYLRLPGTRNHGQSCYRQILC